MHKDTDRENLTKEKTFESTYNVGYMNKKIKKAKYFFIAAITSFILGSMFLVLGEQLRYPLLILAFILILLVLSPLFGIIAASVFFTTRKATGRVFLVFLILFLSPVVLIHGRYFIICFLQYIYTPPSLTSENLAVYNECIKFVKNHDEYKDLTLLRRGWVSIKPDTFYVVDHSSLKKIFSESEIVEMKVLIKQLRAVRCHTLRRYDDMVLFYKAPNSFLPVYPEDIFAIFPVSPGVLYSSNGKDPNKINSEILNNAKPFIKIGGNWYMSRHLMLAGLRSERPHSIQKSLIDHALRIDEIDPNDLY